MAKKATPSTGREVAVIEHEGEILPPVKGEEDFSDLRASIRDTMIGTRKHLETLTAHSIEGKRILFVSSVSVLTTILAKGEEAMVLIPEFFTALGEDRKNQYRTSIFRNFFEKVGPVVWDNERMVKGEDGTEVKEPGFVLHAKKRAAQNRARTQDKAKFDSGLLKAAPWKLAAPERRYQAIDLPEAVALLVKAAERKLSPTYIKQTSATKADLAKNNLEGLDDLKKLAAKLAAHRGKPAVEGTAAVH